MNCTNSTISYAINNASDYFAYGKILRSFESTDEKYRFSGKERDNETELDYFEARLLDTDIGIFRQIDPCFEKRMEWNPFNYCRNNPIRNIDPKGTLDGEYKVTHDADGKEINTKVSDLGDSENIDFYHQMDGKRAGDTKIVNNNPGGKTNWIENGYKYFNNYEKRGKNASWATIVREWAKGEGPQNSLIYGREQAMNKDIRTSNLFLEARNSYLSQKTKEGKGKEEISFAKWLPGLKAVMLSGNNLTMQMMGSTTVSFYDIGNNQRLVLINDSKTVESLNRTGIKFSNLLDINPKRDTRQTYIWIDNNVEE